MPPNSWRVMSVVFAPSSAARRAANTPAGPAPNNDDVHHSSFRDTRLGEGRVSCILATKGGMAWAQPVALVHGPFRLLLEAHVSEEGENDRIDLFRPLFRRLVTNARP